MAPAVQRNLTTEYLAYLDTSAWQTQRRKALTRAEDHCQVCNSPNLLDVHHRTYERFGNENPADLTVLCRPCHELFHKRKRQPAKSTSRRPKNAAASEAAKKPSKRQRRAKTRAEAKARKDDLATQNKHLHELQQKNKLKQQLVREGRSTLMLRPELADRHRS